MWRVWGRPPTPLIVIAYRITTNLKISEHHSHDDKTSNSQLNQIVLYVNAVRGGYDYSLCFPQNHTLTNSQRTTFLPVKPRGNLDIPQIP
jgi:hypothetical protein